MPPFGSRPERYRPREAPARRPTRRKPIHRTTGHGPDSDRRPTARTSTPGRGSTREGTERVCAAGWRRPDAPIVETRRPTQSAPYGTPGTTKPESDSGFGQLPQSRRCERDRPAFDLERPIAEIRRPMATSAPAVEGQPGIDAVAPGATRLGVTGHVAGATGRHGGTSPLGSLPGRYRPREAACTPPHGTDPPRAHHRTPRTPNGAPRDARTPAPRRSGRVSTPGRVRLGNARERRSGMVE